MRPLNASALTRSPIGQNVLTRHGLGSVSPAAADPNSALERWLGSSIMRRPDGGPKVVYHGTASDFTAFDPTQLGRVTGGADARLGFFFAENPNAAAQFTWVNGNQSGQLMPVYLQMQRPFISDHLLDGASGTQAARILRAARDAGHDGVVFKRSDMLGHLGETYVVFEPNQIKSVFNVGSFDAGNTDIRFARSPESALTMARDAAAEAAARAVAFDRWWGDSKVVDANAEPLRLYHGTHAHFAAFSPDQIGSATDDGLFGRGFYFTPHHGNGGKQWGSAGAYAAGEGGWILPVYVSLQRPLVVPSALWGRVEVERAQYDGVIVEEARGGERGPIVEVVAFEPTQIKGVFNLGTFDPTNPDIRFRRQAVSMESPKPAPAGRPASHACAPSTDSFEP